ncbi:MAG: SMC-Scp complex subunit ScpB [Patescibacteria group bacterium]
MTDLATTIEALLFALGRPLARAEAAKLTGASPADLEAAITELLELPRGTTLLDDGNTIELRAAPSAAALIERVRKDEYSRDIGRAGLEALSAVLYRGPLTRAEIDFIRGVNSSQTLRTRTLRGLLRRTPNPKDERSFLYEPTTELLAELGIASVKALPEYAAVRQKLQDLEEAYRAKEQDQ